MLWLKALIGALVVVLISLISRTNVYFVAGLIPLFPTFALISHIIVAERGEHYLKETALFGMYSLIPYFVYLLGVYCFSGRLPLWANLSLSVLMWFVSAVVVFWFFKKQFAG